MSRRKQAKPRAFLKLGESGAEGEDVQQAPPLELLDPKEEILSDNEQSWDDEDEDDEDEAHSRQQRQPHDQERDHELNQRQQQQQQHHQPHQKHTMNDHHHHHHHHLYRTNEAEASETSEISKSNKSNININNNNSNDNSNSDMNSSNGNKSNNNNKSSNNNNNVIDEAVDDVENEDHNENDVEIPANGTRHPDHDPDPGALKVQGPRNEDPATRAARRPRLLGKENREQLGVDDELLGDGDVDGDDEDLVNADDDEDVMELDDELDADEMEDEELEDEDLQSLDSYYSDMYSTHTSSSYSPSVSDGTITPNSLHLHHQQHHQPAHLSLLPPHHQHQHPLDASSDAAGHRARSNGQLPGDGEGDEADDDHDEDAVDAGDNGFKGLEDDGARKKSLLATARLNGEEPPPHSHGIGLNHGLGLGHGHGGHRHHRLGGGRSGRLGLMAGVMGDGLRLPSKLRKLDREAAAAAASSKFDKLTGEGIKSASADGSYQCQFCDKSFPRLGYLKKHEQSHAEHLPFKCDYCARLFKHKRSRDRHTKLHTGDRRYRCPHCEAAFSRSDHLKIHMKTHDNQKPFQCTICNRGYNTAAALTSHMQNHKKQAAILAAGGNPQALLNYSPRSTGSTSASTSSNGSLHKRRYAMTLSGNQNSNSHNNNTSGSHHNTTEGGPSSDFPKRLRSSTSFLACSYCTKSDFGSLEQLNAHVQAMHEKELLPNLVLANSNLEQLQTFQLACEYCTMKFPNIPAMFQHMRSTHVDRLTSPNSYFEHFNRLAASGTFSPRLPTTKARNPHPSTNSSSSNNNNEGGSNHSLDHIKVKREASPKTTSATTTTEGVAAAAKQEEPTDLSQNKRRSQSPEQPQQASQSTSLVRSTPPQPQSSPPRQRSSPAEKPDVFFCNQCNAGLPDFESFRNHLKTHIAQGLSHLSHGQTHHHGHGHGQGQGHHQQVCHHCGLAVRGDAGEYERHVISHFLIASSEYACGGGGGPGGCGKTYAKPEELQKHQLEQHVASVFKCSLCADVFETKVQVQVHLACAHAPPETRLLRCSACMDVFRAEQEFNAHVRTRHQATANGSGNAVPNGIGVGVGVGLGGLGGLGVGPQSLQCMFCRTVCSSELEMHFHLAAHARQFRCPSCPETFHVEFLLDRHMQSHHGGNERRSASSLAPPPAPTALEDPPPASLASNAQLSPMNSLYVNALFGKSASSQQQQQPQNNNSSILDYNVAFAAAHLNKGLFGATAGAGSGSAAGTGTGTGKFYSPLQVDTAGALKHPALMYGLGQRFFDANARTLMDMYQQHQQQQQQHLQQQQQEKTPYFISPKQAAEATQAIGDRGAGPRKTPTESAAVSASGSAAPTGAGTTAAGFSCGLCERNDFRTEAEVHSHRKIVHNLKTGVSLRCAYCSGNFKSRSELEHHMKTCHNSTGKHKCLICDEVFPSPAILAEHKLQHSKVGQSGKCSHCAKPLQDVAAFKGHLAEHNNNNNNNISSSSHHNNNGVAADGQTQMPVQCICCRQSLHSDFEIGLHAKFHTKSSGQPEAVCALCLEPIAHATGAEAKVCERCCRKHNLGAKFPKQRDALPPNNNNNNNNTSTTSSSTSTSTSSSSTASASSASSGAHFIENRCNLCKMILPHPQKLQEHLVEHTFAGCEERGFNCYICSAVFTAPAGLLGHMAEHGPNARPYDCNLCTEKFFFRAELDHHLVNHELRDAAQAATRAAPTTASSSSSSTSTSGSQRREKELGARERKEAAPEKPPASAAGEQRAEREAAPSASASTSASTSASSSGASAASAASTAALPALASVKQEVLEEGDRDAAEGADGGPGEEDDEYIEVEQVPEAGQRDGNSEGCEKRAPSEAD